MDLNALAIYGGLAVLTVALATGVRRVIKTTANVAFVAASIAAVAFQILAYIDLGYLDPFAPIAFVVSWGYCFVVAVLFELGIRMFQRSKPSESRGE